VSYYGGGFPRWASVAADVSSQLQSTHLIRSPSSFFPTAAELGEVSACPHEERIPLPLRPGDESEVGAEGLASRRANVGHHHQFDKFIT